MKIVKVCFCSCIYFTSFGSAEPGDLLEYNYQSTFSISTIQFILNSLGNDLSLPMYNISVYDINRRKVHSQQIVFDSIDISDFSAGFYSLVIKSKERTTAKKILVK